MLKIKNLLIGFGTVVALLIIGFILYFRQQDAYKAYIAEQETVQSSGSTIKGSSEGSEEGEFDAIEFYSNYLGIEVTKVPVYFEQRGLGDVYKRAKTSESAMEVLNKANSSKIEISEEFEDKFGKVNTDINKREGSILVVSYGIEDGLSIEDLVKVINKAEKMGITKVYSYSLDGLKTAISYFGSANTDTKAEDFTGGVKMYKSYPQVYVMTDGKYNEKLTQTLGKIPVINATGKVVGGEPTE